ncbi:MAG TPA: cobalamin-binding protein [Bryobacteraceae bacterium]|nr:cobalamin-binding protein [Bryobacteraceae bacterium]
MPDELRLISLLSSATEIIHALGLGAQQVGRSHECDFPNAVISLPICSRPNIPVNGSSREIDSLVRERAAEAISIYDLDSDLIARLRPTHVVTQTQCKVCAVSLEDVERALRQRTDTDAQIISLEPHALHDVWDDIRRVAEACGRPAEAERLIERLQQRMGEIEERASKAERCPTVATIEWVEPLMVAGNWIPELIQKANATNLFGTGGQHSPYIEWDEIVAADPEVVIAFPCGFDMERTRTELYWLTEQSGWANLRAVREGRVYYCDGNQFMNRPGPRLVESLQILAEILHPDLFPPVFEHSGWQRLV